MTFDHYYLLYKYDQTCVRLICKGRHMYFALFCNSPPIRQEALQIFEHNFTLVVFRRKKALNERDCRDCERSVGIRGNANDSI